MQILLFSEKEKINQMVSETIKNTSHQIKQIDLSGLSTLSDFSEFDVVVIDKKSWQRCAAIFKYFGILHHISNKPLIIIANDNKTRSIKFRESQHKTETLGIPFKSEDFLFTLENIINAPAEVSS